MTAVNLAASAAELPPSGWKSLKLGQVANTHLKLFRVDPAGLPPEAHPDWAEGLVMVEGEMVLELGDEALTLKAGDCVHIPAGVTHAIRPGGLGAFLLVDPEGLI